MLCTRNLLGCPVLVALRDKQRYHLKACNALIALINFDLYKQKKKQELRRQRARGRKKFLSHKSIDRKSLIATNSLKWKAVKIAALRKTKNCSRFSESVRARRLIKLYIALVLQSCHNEYQSLPHSFEDFFFRNLCAVPINWGNHLPIPG